MKDLQKMSPIEFKSCSILASVYALRMLGMFLILPIFAIYATNLDSNPTSLQIGLALVIYR